jgi:hypothetical protein
MEFNETNFDLDIADVEEMPKPKKPKVYDPALFDAGMYGGDWYFPRWTATRQRFAMDVQYAKFHGQKMPKVPGMPRTSGKDTITKKKQK